MSAIEGLPAETRPDAEVLILGSMPGQISLDKKEYYANRGNAFWFIMGELFGAHREKPYEERLAILKDWKIGLWDVLRSCDRNGSLDSAIKNTELNDFAPFFAGHPKLKAVFFNGKQAERRFKRSTELLVSAERLRLRLLPSTSAALAQRPEQKLEASRSAFVQSGVPTLLG